MKKYINRGMEGVFFACASISVVVIVMIAYFVFREGMPIFFEHGVWNMISGRTWNPTREIYGLLPLIYGTFHVTFVALIIGVPLGLATAVFLAEIANDRVARIIRPAIELLAGIPSVVYGLFGMVVINEFMRVIQRDYLGNILPDDYKWGYSILSGGIILAIMILPTIINISEDAIRAVPYKYKEGALGLGATHFQTIFGVILPAARSGIVSAVILGMGRAIGETMALIMVVGNMPIIPDSFLYSIFSPVSTLTATIALEMGYADPTHRSALFAVGMVLFVIIALLNVAGILLNKRAVK